MAKKRKVRTRRVIRKTRAQLVTELNGQNRARGHEKIEHVKVLSCLRRAVKQLHAERRRFEGLENANHRLTTSELKLLRDYHELAEDLFDEQRSRNRGHDGYGMPSDPRMTDDEVAALLPERWEG